MILTPTSEISHHPNVTNITMSPTSLSPNYAFSSFSVSLTDLHFKLHLCIHIIFIYLFVLFRLGILSETFLSGLRGLQGRFRTTTNLRRAVSSLGPLFLVRILNRMHQNEFGNHLFIKKEEPSLFFDKHIDSNYNMSNLVSNENKC